MFQTVLFLKKMCIRFFRGKNFKSIVKNRMMSFRFSKKSGKLGQALTFSLIKMDIVGWSLKKGTTLAGNIVWNDFQLSKCNFKKK